MNRLFIASTISAAAIVLAAVPAVAGLSGNPSFGHQLPVDVPSSAQQVSYDDHGALRTSSPKPSSTAGDERGRSAHPEPGDDRGGADDSSAPSSTVDRNGGQTRHNEPGDNRTGGGAPAPSRSATPATASIPDNKGGSTAPPAPGDDKGGSRVGGSSSGLVGN